MAGEETEQFIAFMGQRELMMRASFFEGECRRQWSETKQQLSTDHLCIHKRKLHMGSPLMVETCMHGLSSFTALSENSVNTFITMHIFRCYIG